MHGRALLHKVHYSPKRDFLIHVGDVLTRGPEKGSMSMLNFLSSRNITGVRGNHDQQVIEWRGWIDWVLSHRGGEKWLERMERMSEEELHLVSKIRKGHRTPSWQEIPGDWEFMGDHYKVAR